MCLAGLTGSDRDEGHGGEANLLSIDVIDFTQGYESEDITDPYPAGDIWFRVGFYGECAGLELTRPR